MFAWNDESWGNAKAARSHDLTLADISHGMFAGTKVATAIGWRSVEAIAEGDQVLTFDGGLQTVVSVTREVVWSTARTMPTEQWPLFVPAGALGNRDALHLLPMQAVMVESDAAEDMFGDPFALIPAAALDGFNGITPVAPQARIEIVRLHFATDQVVFASAGGLIYCPKATDIMADIFETRRGGYTVLSVEAADLLVSCLEFEEQDRKVAAAPQIANFAFA